MPALQHQEQPEEEDRTDNSKAFQKGIKPGQRATPTTVSDQSLATDVGKRATNALTSQNRSDECGHLNPNMLLWYREKLGRQNARKWCWTLGLT